MKLKPCCLTLGEEEFKTLNEKYPHGARGSIRDRALRIVEIFIRRKPTNVDIAKAPKSTGGDLRLTLNGKYEDIEVKGTEDKDIAWNKLKVSGNSSHKALTKGMALYRVSSVFSKNPSIWIIYFKRDFFMTRESRWRISRNGKN